MPWLTKPLQFLLRLPQNAALGLLYFYRFGVSPLFPPRCRFWPSCSAYALEAIRKYGILRGGWLTIKRIGRCHPWSRAGEDPVPILPTKKRTIHG